MARYQYVSCHTLSRAILDPSLRLVSPKWSWVVGGNGSLSANIAVPEDPQQIVRLRAATEPKSAAIYVKTQGGQYPWGGYVTSRSYNEEDGILSITVAEWRSWLYRVPLPPNPTTGADVTYTWTGIDQIQIARDIVAFAAAGGAAMGSPSIINSTEPLSGKLRDLTLYGTAMKNAGSLIDSLSNRDGGFDWTLDTRPHPSDGLPQLYFTTYYPQRGSIIAGLMFRRTPDSGNLVANGPIEEDASERYDRFWATGAGSAPDQVFAQDTDPELANGTRLRFEGNSNFGSVSVRATLAGHARKARKFYSAGIDLVPVETTLINPDVDSYSVGDRGRYTSSNRWDTHDHPTVRIVEKAVNMAGAGKVELTVDLTDFTLPEVDAGGSI